MIILLQFLYTTDNGAHTRAARRERGGGGGGFISLRGPISLVIWDLVRGRVSLEIWAPGTISLAIWYRGAPQRGGGHIATIPVS